MDVSKESKFLIVKCNLRPLPNGGYGALSIFTGFLLIADSFFIKGESQISYVGYKKVLIFTNLWKKPK